MLGNVSFREHSRKAHYFFACPYLPLRFEYTTLIELKRVTLSFFPFSTTPFLKSAARRFSQDERL